MSKLIAILNLERICEVKVKTITFDVALASFSCPLFNFCMLFVCRIVHWTVTFWKIKITIWNRFEQTSSSSGSCREGHEKDCVGGIARIYTAVNQLVKERPNAIFLNAGDHFQGTLWYNIHRWNVTALFMNMLPHDAMVITMCDIFVMYA